MYGMVNRGIEDLVKSLAGDEAWEDIRANADLPDKEFVNSVKYPDEDTFKLVNSASAYLQLSSYEVLRAFGRHWILFTGREQWHQVFQLGGNTMMEFLNGLDAMHSRVQVAMPESSMPHFSVVEIDDYLELTYKSERSGLGPMVHGLLDGLAVQFSESWDIQHQPEKSKPGCEIFYLRRN